MPATTLQCGWWAFVVSLLRWQVMGFGPGDAHELDAFHAYTMYNRSVSADTTELPTVH
jgi:hypothetical protein